MADASSLVIADYDPVWAETFRRLQAFIAPALDGISADIQHVGSTAVPGLAAKPIIDIDVVVESEAVVPLVIARLAELGYRHEGNLGLPGREAFQQPPGLPIHHLYVVVAGSRPHLDHVLLRDLLRRDPEAADAYAAEKRRHAHLLPVSRLAYLDAKAAVVEALLSRARAEAGLSSEESVDVHGVAYRWRSRLPSAAVGALAASAFGDPVVDEGWWDRVRPRSLGWVSAHLDGRLVGFVNVAWDGAAHAFLLDTAVEPDVQRQQIGTRLVRRAAEEARAAGCDWLHVDFEARLSDFYLRACGFRSTAAGLIRLAETPSPSTD